MRCDLDGRGFQLVIGHRNPSSLAVFGPYLFWLESDSGQYFWPHYFGSGGCGLFMIKICLCPMFVDLILYRLKL